MSASLLPANYLSEHRATQYIQFQTGNCNVDWRLILIRNRDPRNTKNRACFGRIECYEFRGTHFYKRSTLHKVINKKFKPYLRQVALEVVA